MELRLLVPSGETKGSTLDATTAGSDRPRDAELNQTAVTMMSFEEAGTLEGWTCSFLKVSAY